MLRRGFLDINSDILGAAASFLCIIHCLLTPFIFVAQASVSHVCSEISPFWWKSIDLFFLAITIAAVYFTAKSTNLKWMPISLWTCWIILAFLVLNKFINLVSIPHFIVYIPAISLSVLHIYNRRYCNCDNEVCQAH